MIYDLIEIDRCKDQPDSRDSKQVNLKLYYAVCDYGSVWSEVILLAVRINLKLRLCIR